VAVKRKEEIGGKKGRETTSSGEEGGASAYIFGRTGKKEALPGWLRKK